MATISTQSLAQDGVFTLTWSTLTASDTFTLASNQYLLFWNDTAGSLTAVVDGAGSTTKTVDGVGAVDVSAGVSVVVAAGASKVLNCNSRKAFLQGVITITGADGLKCAVVTA